MHGASFICFDRVIYANILLNANAGWPDHGISKALRVSVPTIERLPQRFVEKGLEGAQEAHLIALAGGARWGLSTRLSPDRSACTGIVHGWYAGD
jgi:hypothetical protein